MNIDELKGAIQSGVIQFPQGLTREERRQYVTEQLPFLKEQSTQQIFNNLSQASTDGTIKRLDNRPA